MKNQQDETLRLEAEDSILRATENYFFFAAFFLAVFFTAVFLTAVFLAAFFFAFAMNLTPDLGMLNLRERL